MKKRDVIERNSYLQDTRQIVFECLFYSNQWSHR